MYNGHCSSAGLCIFELAVILFYLYFNNHNNNDNDNPPPRLMVISTTSAFDRDFHHVRVKPVISTTFA